MVSRHVYKNTCSWFAVYFEASVTEATSALKATSKTLCRSGLPVQCTVQSGLRHHEECHIALATTISKLFLNLSVTDSSTEEDDSWTSSDRIIILVLIKNYPNISFLELFWSFYSILHAWEKSTLGWAIIFQCTWQLLLSLVLKVLFIKAMSSVQGDRM